MTGVLAGVVVYRRDRRAIAADPAHAELAEPLIGRPIAVASDDATVLHAEVHGPDDGITVVLSGAGHMIPIEAPVDVAHHLRRLVAGR